MSSRPFGDEVLARCKEIFDQQVRDLLTNSPDAIDKLFRPIFEKIKRNGDQAFQRPERTVAKWFANSPKAEPDLVEAMLRIVKEKATPIPSPGAFERIRRECFEASLRTEEGKSVWFEVRLVASDYGSENQTVRFDSPKPFDARLLVKLSPALARPGAWLAIMEASTGSLHAHSLASFGRGGEETFKVRVLAPGQLEFSFAGNPIAEQRGLSSRMLPGRSHFPATEVIRGWTGTAPINPAVCLWALEDIAATLRRGRSGGTVAVLPGDTPADHLIRLGHQVDQSQLEAWPTVLKEWDARFENPQLSWREREYRQLIEFIASLAAIDGAVVLGSDFRIRSFGSILDAPPWEGPLNLVHARDGTRETAVKERFPGTRHRSAANYAKAVPGSLLIVVSHDGDVTLFYTFEGQVKAFQPDMPAMGRPTL